MLEHPVPPLLPPVPRLHRFHQRATSSAGSGIERSGLLLAVSSVTAQWGLAEASHFGELFRAEFAVSPRDFREAALGTDS